MAQRIDNASRSQYNLNYDDSETTRLANDISEVSGSLSIHVTNMRDNFNSFVSYLGVVQVMVKKELSLAEQILGWLRSGTSLEHMALPCKDRNDRLFDAEPQEGNESESLRLRNSIPQKDHSQGSTERPKKTTVDRFDEALDIMGLERHMREGRRVTLYCPDPAAVAEKWRNVAKKYKSMLPDPTR